MLQRVFSNFLIAAFLTAPARVRVIFVRGLSEVGQTSLYVMYV